MKHFLLFFSLLIFYDVKAQDTLLLKQRDQIEGYIKQLHQRGYFNGTLLVAKQDSILFYQSYGLAKLYSNDSIKNNYPYQMASVSKPVTASTIMLLVQKGELNLEDKMVKYLPELMHFNQVKIKHLLNHTSGLPEYIYQVKIYWKKDGYMGNDDLLQFLSSKNRKLAFRPGSKFHYCNTNYALLASIIERISDQKFDDFVSEQIFKPIGMTNSFIFNPNKDTSACHLIKGYYWNGKSFTAYNHDLRNGIMGDKGLFSTAEDMMRFAVAFNKDEIWCLETCQDIFSRTKLSSQMLSEYGAGWRMREWDGRQVVLHYGFWNSFRTGLIHFPNEQVTYVILNNLTGTKAINNREQIIKALNEIMFPGVIATEAPMLADEPSLPELMPESTGEDN